jgi:hypothetical protein
MQLGNPLDLFHGGRYLLQQHMLVVIGRQRGFGEIGDSSSAAPVRMTPDSPVMN